MEDRLDTLIKFVLKVPSSNLRSILKEICNIKAY